MQEKRNINVRKKEKKEEERNGFPQLFVPRLFKSFVIIGYAFLKFYCSRKKQFKVNEISCRTLENIILITSDLIF